jgi:translation initiation factor 2 beta subunit (eIF-2beta)/eIF-5
METLIIDIPENKSSLVKSLLKELGVTIHKKSAKKVGIPNEITRKTIEDAHKGIGVGEPIKDIKSFLGSL